MTAQTTTLAAPPATAIAATARVRAEAPPPLSSRPFTETDGEAVLDLFAEPDFYFRTVRPDALAQAEILELVSRDTHVILAEGRVVGLYAVEPAGAEHGCHYELHLRLRAEVPDAWWHMAYHAVVEALLWRAEIVRLVVRAGEFDTRWLRILGELGLNDEGVLADVVLHRGARHGYRYMSRLWPPTGAADGPAGAANAANAPAVPPGGSPARIAGYRESHGHLLRGHWVPGELLGAAIAAVDRPVLAAPHAVPAAAVNQELCVVPGAGFVRYAELDWIHRRARLEIGLREGAEGRAAAVLAAAVDFGFTNLGLHRLYGWATSVPGLGADAAATLAAAGFSREASIPEALWFAGRPRTREIWGVVDRAA
jgi:hypothetical protein